MSPEQFRAHLSLVNAQFCELSVTISHAVNNVEKKEHLPWRPAHSSKVVMSRMAVSNADDPDLFELMHLHKQLRLQ